MKAIDIINELNRFERLLDTDVMIKDSFGNYASFQGIGTDDDGDLFITVDNKHYITKVIEHKTEIPEAKKY